MAAATLICSLAAVFVLEGAPMEVGRQVLALKLGAELVQNRPMEEAGPSMAAVVSLGNQVRWGASSQNIHKYSNVQISSSVSFRQPKSDQLGKEKSVLS